MNVVVGRCQNRVGGVWVDAVEVETAEILNPAAAQPIDEVPPTSLADVDRAREEHVMAKLD